MVKPTLLLSACAMLVGVAIGAPNIKGRICDLQAYFAVASSNLPAKDNYNYVVNGLSGSDAKAAFPDQADKLSEDKTYRFSVNLKACKRSHVAKRIQHERGADNQAGKTRTLSELSEKVGLDPTYAKLFKSLPIARDQYSISGGSETVVVRGLNNAQSDWECIVSVGWKCDGRFQVYDGDELVVDGTPFHEKYFPVSVNGRHLFKAFMISV